MAALRWHPTPQQQAQEAIPPGGGIAPPPIDISGYTQVPTPPYPAEAYLRRPWAATIPRYVRDSGVTGVFANLTGAFPRTMQIDNGDPEGGVSLDWEPQPDEVSRAGTVYGFAVVYSLQVAGLPNALNLPPVNFLITGYDRGYSTGTVRDDASVQLYDRQYIWLEGTPWAHPDNPQGILRLRHLSPTPVGFRTFRLDQRNDALLRQIEELENGDYARFVTDQNNALSLAPLVDGMILGQTWTIDFTNRQPPYKTVYFQGSGLPAEVRVQEMVAPTSEDARNVDQLMAFNGRLYAEVGSNLHEIRRDGTRIIKAEFFGFSEGGAVFDGFLYANTDRANGRRLQVFNSTFTRAGDDQNTETRYSQPNIAGIPNYSGPRIPPPPARQRAPFFVGMATPSESSKLGWGLGDTHIYNLWAQDGGGMTASLKPISDAGVVDSAATDRGPHGLTNPQALAYYRDRLIAIDGHGVRVINTDGGNAVGPVVANLPRSVEGRAVNWTGMTVLNGELFAVTDTGYPFRISAFETQTGAEPPTGFRARRISDDEIGVEWATVRGLVYQGLGGANRGSWAAIVIDPLTREFTFTGLTPNTRSTVSIRSLYAGVEGEQEDLTVLMLPDAPDISLHSTSVAPTTPTPTAVFQGTLEAGERLQYRRSTATGTDSRGNLIYGTPTAWADAALDSQNRWSDSGLAQAGNYRYEWRARNDDPARAGTLLAGGISPDTTVIPVNAGASQPTLRGIPVITSNAIALSINRVATLNYEYAATPAGGTEGPWTDLPADGVAIAGFVPDDGTAPENVIKIRSFGRLGASPTRSAELVVTFVGAPATPANLAANNENFAGYVLVNVGWTQLPGLRYWIQTGRRPRSPANAPVQWLGGIREATINPFYVDSWRALGAYTQGVRMYATSTLTPAQTARGVLSAPRSAWTDYRPLL